MMFVSWRISGKGFVPRQFVQRFKLSTDAIFMPGESQIGGRVIQTPSCNITIPIRGDSNNSLISGIHRFITLHKSAFRYLKYHDISSVIDIGVIVGGKKHFTRSVVFSNKSLSMLAELCVELAVSSYPSSEK